MPDVEQFIPASADQSIDMATMREAVAMLRPDMADEQFAQQWRKFLAVKRRVENPRRRIGTDVARRGPVLFDPCQYLNRSEDR